MQLGLAQEVERKTFFWHILQNILKKNIKFKCSGISAWQHRSLIGHMEAASYQIDIEGDDGGSFWCVADDLVLLAMEHQGQHLIPVGCRRGGCGICKVQVLSGEYETLVMSRAQVSINEEADRYALACRLMPKSDLKISVVNKIWIERRKEQLQKQQLGG